MDKFKVIFLIIIYVVSIFITGIFVLVTISEVLRGKGFNVLFAVLSVMLFFIPLYLNRVIADSKDDIIENHALKMAISHEGFVTAFEIAANNSLRLKDVNKYLERCCGKGICEKRVIADNSVEVFYFKDSISLELKKTSKPISKY